MAEHPVSLLQPQEGLRYREIWGRYRGDITPSGPPLQPQEGLITLGEVGLEIGAGLGIGLGLGMALGLGMGIGVGTSGAAAACWLSGSAWNRSGCTRRAMRRNA